MRAFQFRAARYFANRHERITEAERTIEVERWHDEVVGRLNLRNIFPNDDLLDTDDFRQHVYTLLSDCNDVSEHCLKLLRTFNNYAERTMIGRNRISNDIVDTWASREDVIRFDEHEHEEHIMRKVTFLKKSDPLFSDLKLQDNCDNATGAYPVKKIGLQHIRLSARPRPRKTENLSTDSDDSDSDSSATSMHYYDSILRASDYDSTNDSDSGSDLIDDIESNFDMLEPNPNSSTDSDDSDSDSAATSMHYYDSILRASDYDSSNDSDSGPDFIDDIESNFDMLEPNPKASRIDLYAHKKNYTVVDSTVKCQTDVLIFIPNDDVSQSLAQHLGFVSLETLLQDEVNIAARLMRPEAGLYQLAQTEIAKQLMDGRSNICITSNVGAWSNIEAAVRAVVVTDGEKDEFVHLMRDANYFVVVEEQDAQLAYVAAIGEILNESLSANVVVPAKYELDENKFTTVNIPLAALIPFYILRYFAQSYHKTQKTFTTKPDEIFSKP